MKEKLKASVNAIAAKDVEAFHKTLGPGIGTEHDYLLNNVVNFTTVDKAHEENGRILVAVNGENLRQDGGSPVMGYTFYFEQEESADGRL
ncbi:hypothetical protein [Paenibacillus yonginensis]|nr:hypothetical protein [Paenibacillus yonginensis]